MKIITLKEKNLTLKNEGTLELFFLGTGSAFTKRQYQTNLLIIKGNDHLLIDCGTKCSQAIAELGLDLSNINNYLITHSHADHIGGLEEVSLYRRYVTREKPVMVITEQYQNILWNMSLRGGCEYNEYNEDNNKLLFEDYWDVLRPELLPDYSRETFGIKVDNIDIKMMRTIHIPDSSSDWQNSFWSCGVIIDDRILFTSDTRHDEDLIKFYDSKFNLEAIFHDCQFFTGGVHASLDELNNFPNNIKSKMYLTHYGDNWENFEDKIKDYGFAGLAIHHQFYQFDYN
ncbi:MAG: MBL fold metallo-hydrolase [Leptospirales bacterium]|nr:MBL fold metallo-hydrolase [Leptospirales bacterium]